MKGKDKCRMLKQIRKKIADANDIPYVVEECPHKGECLGTCPKCEAELKKLEEELSLRRRLGKGVAVVGLATGMMAATTACTPADIIEAVDALMNPISHNRQLDGVLPAPLEGEALPVYPEIDGDVSYEPIYENEIQSAEETLSSDDVEEIKDEAETDADGE
ncbi:MAG: hypothetical protein J5845_01215 [Lachnospiraceae bacterium]|nr:hypothetical protein [Lachnospiraceae bacterium]